MNNLLTNPLSTKAELYCKHVVLFGTPILSVVKQGDFGVIRPIHSISSSILFI